MKFLMSISAFVAVEVLKGCEFSRRRGRSGVPGSGLQAPGNLRCCAVSTGWKPESGTIRVLDQHVDGKSKRINALRRQIGMVFQRFNLFPHRSVLENVMEGPIYVNGETRSKAEKMAKELLERVGLGDKVSAWPSQLSGGQQQRVAIARTLALQPKAILFDEPTSALDPELVGEVLQVMRNLAQQGMTMIVVTHEMQFAREVADRVCFLHSGQIVEQGHADEVLLRPQEARTQDFLRRVLGNTGVQSLMNT